jgi:hypothetical protein
MRAVFSIIGSSLFLLGPFVCYGVAGGHASVLWRPVPIIGIIVASLGSSILTFGCGDVWESLLSVRYLFRTPSGRVSTRKSLAVVRFLIISFYAVGSLFLLLHLLITRAVIAGPLEQIGKYVAVSVLSLVYPILISEGLLRPLKYRLEFLAEQK